LNAFSIRRAPTEPLKLLVLCGALFASFLPIGVITSAILGRMSARVSRLYFADLAGAAAACAAAIPLLRALTPPGCIMAAACCQGVIALLGPRPSRRLGWWGVVAATAATAALAVFPGVLPDPVTDSIKTVRPETKVLYSRWNPVFRIDVTESLDPNVRIIHHDGLWGSTLQHYTGNLRALSRFDHDPRSLPFATLGRPPAAALVVGAAGGHEVLTSLYYGSERIVAVELNDATIGLLKGPFRKYTGDLISDPHVEYVHGEGRSFLARSRDQYDLIYFVAPDSYTATSAAAAGAFVLSESYLYTVEAIRESLRHLKPDGVVCMQFGEFDYEAKPNRTARYVSTARQAFADLGIRDFSRHLLVATTPGFMPFSTILLKRTPFAPAEIERFRAQVGRVSGSIVRYPPGPADLSSPVSWAADLPLERWRAWLSSHRYNLSPVRDDSPFFWHFARFRRSVASWPSRLSTGDTEEMVGERLLAGMLLAAALYAASFLLLPFFFIRDTWRQLPFKRASAVYFACLGLGFMFIEVALIQKLTLFLGYPTYSLTVTLAALLVFAGLGARLSERYVSFGGRAVLGLFACVGLWVLSFALAGPPLIASLLHAPLPIRAATAVSAIAPLGLALGGFMPVGLHRVAAATPFKTEYVAWGWAVNGFFSVIGSVLAVVLAMSYGFSAVLAVAVGLYGVAAWVIRKTE
ncbi:MAG: hypothetical protein D6815_05620, partial [Candidatus Dadabacteria bacterium]